MATSIRPLHDRLLIKRLDEQEQVRGGIIIPDTAKEKPQQGEVIAAGSGKFRGDGTRQPLDGSRATACYSGSTAARKQKLMMRNIYRVSYFLRVFCFPWRFGGSKF